ncbi:GNAT family N-acetyltransferase [Planococcus salinarum]|uniref:GNAT family N-acetyltransferase n=1 Tax=Planococcus salinarum TaxID=622695 RepID=UPI000E3D3B43|nr:GNAT family protein [Planococcus salinarum]TAA67466.1 N-acetyltransferase [Planococcus salinarum]
MAISLTLLQEADAQELYDFEVENRRFFEKMVPGRGDDYFVWETFIQRHQDLLDEQETGLSRFYLVKDENDRIAGRMNLMDIDKENGVAEIGFRIGKAHIGKGIGNHALNLLLSEPLPVRQIRAKTTTVNIPSQKVLEKNGFIRMGIGDEEFEMNAQKMRFVHYLWEKQK